MSVNVCGGMPPAPSSRRLRCAFRLPLLLAALLLCLCAAPRLSAQHTRARDAPLSATVNDTRSAASQRSREQTQVPPQLRMRGLWIASVAHIDWPSRAGMTPEQQRSELQSLYDLAVTNRLNAVFVQVRPTADAFWPSPYEPWSAWLTGTQGQDPGWDPLAFAVKEAHARDLQFHAWFNPYRITMPGGTDVSQLAPSHPARRNPHWTVLYNKQLLYNPGLPEVRRFVADAMLDAVQRYDIDGLHWDDYFYPYPAAGQEFDDDAAWKAHGAGFASRADWRRNNVDLLVSEMRVRLRDMKPWVSFGISPFAVWRNRGSDPAGSNTTAGCQTYDDLYADTRLWVKKEWIDYIAPQIYWHVGFAAADYATLLQWWADTVRGTRVQLYIGEAVYRVGAAGQPPEWQQAEELSRHLQLALQLDADNTPQMAGHIYFSAEDVAADRLGAMKMLVQRFYSNFTQAREHRDSTQKIALS